MSNNHKMNPCYELCLIRYHKKFDEEECRKNCEFASVCVELANKHEEYNRLLGKFEKLKEDFMELVIESDRMCYYCKHHIECKGKNCPKYENGKGAIDDEGNPIYPNWEWTCLDFDYGTCSMLRDTPCNGCIENDNRGFEWRGEEQYGRE